ncbi:MAG: hypothetical protein H6R00_4893 [Proteobacteria bacterium]|nr:hypothetical protein [Pseudomonadota bacterium]
MKLGTKAYEYIERFGPIATAISVLVVFYVFSSEFIGYIRGNNLKINLLYGEIFDWSSIQTGFLFGVYGFIAGKSDGFIGQIRHTRPVKQFLAYTRNAIVIGFVLTFVSMPLILIDIGPSDITKNWYYITCSWFSLFIWSFLSFARAAYIFGLIIRVDDNRRIRG